MSVVVVLVSIYMDLESEINFKLKGGHFEEFYAKNVYF